MSIFVKMQWLVLLNGHFNKIIGLLLVCGGSAINASWPTVSLTDLYAQSKTWAKVGLDVNEIPSGILKDKVQHINIFDFISGNYILVLRSEKGTVFSTSLVKL